MANAYAFMGGSHKEMGGEALTAPNYVFNVMYPTKTATDSASLFCGENSLPRKKAGANQDMRPDVVLFLIG